MERSLRQRSIVDFCHRQNRSQPSAAQHGHCPAEEVQDTGQSDLNLADKGRRGHRARLFIPPFLSSAQHGCADAARLTTQHHRTLPCTTPTLDCSSALVTLDNHGSTRAQSTAGFQLFDIAMCAGISSICPPSTHRKAQQSWRASSHR